jgi:predicted secreted hydrolase
MGSDNAGRPTFVDLASDQGRHVEPHAEIWYVTCRLDGPDRELGTQLILTTSPSGHVFTSVSMLDVSTGSRSHATTRHRAVDVHLANGTLDLRTPNATLSGSTGELRLHGATGDDHFDLTLERRGPVLYNGGTGQFPYFHGPTFQYAFPDLAVTGTVVLDGVATEVTGGGWYDRQWAASRDAFGTANAFAWFGLCLGGGDSISLWDTADGQVWATVVHPDGTHTVTAVEATTEGDFAASASGVPGHWTLHEEPGFYTGICRLGGTYRGVPASGYGFVDLVPK